MRKGNCSLLLIYFYFCFKILLTFSLRGCNFNASLHPNFAVRWALHNNVKRSDGAQQHAKMEDMHDYPRYDER